MTTASDLQVLLRFLSQDAKIPLATCMSKVQSLQTANLSTPELLSKAKPKDLEPIFEDPKICKQIISAAKRVSKKRAAAADGEETIAPSPKKKKISSDERLFSAPPVAPEDLEGSLKLPTCDLSEDELKEVVVFTNRAPLVLAFLAILLRYTMPEQPLSSRLSLAQAYVSVTSKSRAIYLGIEGGKSAEEEGYGEGQPEVVVAGKKIKVLRRWGYEWEAEEVVEKMDEKEAVDGKAENDPVKKEDESIKQETEIDAEPAELQPALWGLDLEALKKSESNNSRTATGVGTHSNLPVHTPQSARAYLAKAFDTAPPNGAPAPAKKGTAAARVAEKEANLGKLLRAIELLYQSWSSTVTPAELDNRTWNWYAKVRPAVADGAEGWGGKNRLRLADILALRRSE